MAASNKWCDDQRTKTLTAYGEILQSGRHPREEYKELIQPCYVSRRGQADGLAFRAPGGFHQARRMPKSMSCIKITLFVGQALLRGREANDIRRVPFLSPCSGMRLSWLVGLERTICISSRLCASTQIVQLMHCPVPALVHIRGTDQPRLLSQESRAGC